MATKNHTSRQWLAIRLPQLSLEVFAPENTQAFAVTEKQRVLCVNKAAQHKGITPGITAATAQMLAPCQLVERDKSLEQEAIHQLADTLYNYTPYIEKQTPNTCTDCGLLVEISQSLKLFKGLDRIIQQITQDLSSYGYQFMFGLGHTNKAAWLLSFTSQTTPPHNREQTLLQLAPLGISLLSQCPQAMLSQKELNKHITALDKSGFNTLSDILTQLKNQSLASFRQRFGDNFSRLLADTFGIEQNLQQSCLLETPPETYQPVEFFFDSLQFEYPITDREQLLQPMEILLQNLSDYLTQRQQQCQKIVWTLLDIYHNKQTLTVHTCEGQQRGTLLLELTHIQLQNENLAFEIDTLELSCRDTAPQQHTTHDLSFHGHHKHKIQHDFTLTTARLKARLGNDALFKLTYNDSHLPEQSNIPTTIDDQTAVTLPIVHQYALRPSWIFHRPLPVQLKRQQLYWRGTLELLQGPERIENNWWQEPTTRDYFMAQRDDFLRLWVFYDMQTQQWFVQGVFGY